MISNEEMKNMKIVKFREDCGLLMKGITQTVPKYGFFSTLLGTLDGKIALGKLIGKFIIRQRNNPSW